MATFQKDVIVRNIVHYRKHVKFSQLFSVEDSWTDSKGNEWLTLTQLIYGTTQRNIPAENMQLVSSAAVAKIMDVSNKSKVVF